jgi:hypothetical protein
MGPQALLKWIQQTVRFSLHTSVSRGSISTHNSRGYGHHRRPGRPLAKAFDLLLDPGDIILTEDYTYSGALSGLLHLLTLPSPASAAGQNCARALRRPRHHPGGAGTGLWPACRSVPRSLTLIAGPLHHPHRPESLRHHHCRRPPLIYECASATDFLIIEARLAPFLLTCPLHPCLTKLSWLVRCGGQDRCLHPCSSLLSPPQSLTPGRPLLLPELRC